jgi:hypothetical protein
MLFLPHSKTFLLGTCWYPDHGMLQKTMLETSLKTALIQVVSKTCFDTKDSNLEGVPQAPP